MRSATVFGSSGLVGTHLVRELLADPTYGRVTVVVRPDSPATPRRTPPAPHPTLKVVTADLDTVEGVGDDLAADDVYLTLGTTRARTPDPAAYYRIDHDYPVRAAAVARRAGATRACVVTSVGADAGSRSAYLRTKGEVERDLAAVGFDRLHVFRPSMLLGDRAERRPLEWFLIGAFRLVNPLFAGPADRFRGVEVADLARAMVAATSSDAATAAAVTVHHWRDVARLAGRAAR